MTHLMTNDTVEFIAPASKFDPSCLHEIKNLVEGWGFRAKISCPFSDEWLCTTGERERFEVLKNALLDPEVKAIWGVHGGHGCTHLLPYLDHMPEPPFPKLLMGFSDITALHLFVHKKWNWGALHCPSARQAALAKACPQSIEGIKNFLSGKVSEIAVKALNGGGDVRDATIVGGNLSLVTSSLGTPWQIETEGKFLFLEEIGERAYKVDRMLTHLQQAGVMKKARGVIWGDFIQRETLQADEQTKKLLSEWTEKLPFPVYSVEAGHGFKNTPIPLNTAGLFLKKSLN